jgi:hypothetical protein
MGEAGAMTLAKVALLGTARSGGSAPTGTPVDEIVARLQGVSVERRLLLAAGAAGVFRRAGHRARAGVEPARPPAPDEILPVCPPGVTAVLRDVFAEVRLELLPEAFTSVARTGRRVPSSLLVDCLDLDGPSLRESARPVLGERGRWLAEHRAAWAWARASSFAPPTVDEMRQAWDEGRFDERLAAIGCLRDIDPDGARELIARGWKAEPSEARLAIASLLSRRLSASDEAWLLAAATDRARAVRAAIASLLARLPGSPVATRANARAEPLLDWTPETRRASPPTGRLLVNPPDAFDPSWEADGFLPRPPRGVGERAHWLAQALALVHPAHWSARFRASPDSLVRAARATDWAVAVMEGWSLAAMLHEASDWIVTLWEAWLDMPPGADPHAEAVSAEMLMRLYARLPSEAAEARIGRFIATGATRPGVDLETALARFETPWPDIVGAHVLHAIETAASSPGVAIGAQLAGLFRTAGPALPVSQLDRAAALAANPSVLARSHRAFDLFARQIALRARLHYEITR